MTDNDIKLLFDHSIKRIRCDADQIRQWALTLSWINNYTSDMDRYDLKQSEQALRDAADFVGRVREKLERKPAIKTSTLVAAE